MSAFSNLRKVFKSKSKRVPHAQLKSGVSKEDHLEKDIDYQMSLAEKREKRLIRILLLGPGDSGKSTIVKQMKRIHQTLDPKEVVLIRPYIKEAVVGYIKLLCLQSHELAEKEEAKTEMFGDDEILRKELLALQPPYNLDEKLAAKITKLWSNPAIQRTFALCHKYQIHDNVAYFLDKVDEIQNKDYTPSFDDYVRFRSRSTGLSVERITAKIDSVIKGEYCFEITDVGGQRSERQKWMRIVMDNIQTVLFVVALSEYDLACFEDNKTNRLVEAIELFRSCVGGKFFVDKTVVVFFNKYDLFSTKIREVPITVAFPDYPKNQSPHDENLVIQYVAGKFLQCFDVKKGTGIPLHFHRTTALDTHNVQRVFDDITLDLVRMTLQGTGMAVKGGKF